MNNTPKQLQTLIDEDDTKQAKLRNQLIAKNITPNQYTEQMEKWSKEFKKRLYEIMCEIVGKEETPSK